MSDPPTTSVVLATRGRPGFSARTVASVLGGTRVPDELIVVDQSPTPDPTLTALADDAPSVRILRTTSSGLSRARNVGAAAASGDIVAFIDDDELADPAWLAALVAVLSREGDRTAVTGRVLPGEAEGHDALVSATVLEPHEARYRGRLGRDVLAGGNMGIHRSTFEALGGFDLRLGPGARWPAAEDNDLGLRLLEAGYSIVYVPEAVVRHRAWRSGRSYPVLRWRYGLGKGGFYAKHARLDGGYGLRRAARDVGRRPARAVVTVWRRPRFAAGELLYAIGVVVGMTRWLRGERTS